MSQWENYVWTLAHSSLGHRFEPLRMIVVLIEEQLHASTSP
jgi:hypothetical protein